MNKELIARLREAATQRVASTAMIGADDLIAAADALESQAATPSSHWRAEGAPDPHAGHYDGERATLAMGKLTDDELANGAFMNYDQPLNLDEIIAGIHSSPIAWMTAVKDRILWLSRSLEGAAAERDALATELKAAREQEPVAVYKGHRHIPSNTKEFWGMADNHLPAGTHLYAHPVTARELTDEDINKIWDAQYEKYGQMSDSEDWNMFARAIEHHLKGEET